MQQLIQRVRDRTHGFVLGEPWQFNERALGAMVPIINEKPVERNYLTHPEIVEGFDIKDGGGIQEMFANNEGDLPIFVRAGSLLKGATQTRTVVHSLVVFPGKERVEVRCVYASSPIRAGAATKYAGTVPHEVHRMASTGNQHGVWTAVTAYVAGTTSTLTNAEGHRAYTDFATSQGDDVAGYIEAVRESSDRIKEFLKKTPEFEGQVGALFLTQDGVIAMEMFDHPDSWHAFAKDVAMSYSDVLTGEMAKGLFTLEPDRARDACIEYLDTMSAVRGREVWKRQKARTQSFADRGLTGEWTDIEERTIHVLSQKGKEETRQVEPGRHLEPRAVVHDWQTVPASQTVNVWH